MASVRPYAGLGNLILDPLVHLALGPGATKAREMNDAERTPSAQFRLGSSGCVQPNPTGACSMSISIPAKLAEPFHGV